MLQSSRNLAAIFTVADFMKGGLLPLPPVLLCRYKEAVANFDNFVVEVAMKYWLKRRISLLKKVRINFTVEVSRCFFSGSLDNTERSLDYILDEIQ